MKSETGFFTIFSLFSFFVCNEIELDDHRKIYEFQAENIDGKVVSMEKYR